MAFLPCFRWGVFSVGVSMPDPNMDDFLGRVARIQEAHALGQSFVADGTLSRPVPRRKSRHWPVARGILFVLLLLSLFKAVMLHQVGDGAYAAKVASLQAGGTVDRLGAAVMAADPLTLWLSRQVGLVASFL